MAERGPGGSFLNRRTTTLRSPDTSLRRRVLHGGLLIGSIAAGLALAWEESDRIRSAFNDPSNAIVERVKEDFSLCKDLCGTPIEGEEAKSFLTDSFDETDFAIVRSEPTQGDNIVGFAEPGQEVIAEAYYGVVYNSSAIDSHGLGKIIGPDGQPYGKWFQIHKLEVLIADENGEYTKKQILFNQFVGGNFLKPHPASPENTATK